MFLTDARIKAAKRQSRPYKLSDGDGLYLLIKPSNSRLWRFKYLLHKKENVYSIGSYPEFSLAEAREERFRLRKMVKTGIDPNLKKKEAKFEIVAKEENSFAAVALEWHSRHSTRWAARHSKRNLNWLNNDILPIIGHIQIAELKPLNILSVVRKIDARGSYNVANRVLNVCSQILRYGIAICKCNYDVTIGVNQALTTSKRKNFKCIPVKEFPELLQKIQQSHCKPLTRLALQLMALTFVRTTELRAAKWQEINFDTQEWRIPPERMKMGDEHIVPLSVQGIKILKAINVLGYHSEYVFPNETNMRKIMSENTMLYALYDMGYHNKMTVHGFRQLASTILNEIGFNRDAIERQLSHTERNSVRRAYNHAQYLPERREMMKWWGDYIDRLSHEW